MFNTAYTGLFDRSLLHLSSNLVELALKNATSKSSTPVFMYQFDPIGLLLCEIIKTSHTQIFLFFSIMERIGKGIDVEKKLEVTEHPTKILAHQVNAKVTGSMFLLSFRLGACA